jgi:hypothetical protein
MAEWAVWTGIEVEGQYKGFPTLFLFAEPDQPFDDQWLTLRPHIYICANWLRTMGTGILDRALAHAIVTVEIELDQLPLLTPEQLERCHLMLVVNLPRFAQEALKPTDTVRLTFAPFVTSSYTHPLCSYPEDYSQDVLIALAKTTGQFRQE